MPPVLTLPASEVAAWEKERNAAHVTINWHFTAEHARIKLRHLYPTINIHLVRY